MRLVVLGCAGSYPSVDAAASSYLVQADDAAGRTWTVLLDLGNGALSPLQQFGDPTALDAIEPDPVALVHPLDLEGLGAKPGELITIESRRGKVSLYARADDTSPRGAIFVPFCYYEAAINRLTNDAFDPVAKIPELKYCAIRVAKGGTPPEQVSFGGGQILRKLGEAAPL